ncbi:helix-turn-helix domain-containing protein [Thomasclavelia cocleata]|jgi:transcriptional regulator with XRE-family HTH domain|uniref:helix-turn-helix domain-containing protein n=1 Tax=Thomasclavelia cocleata TaxID=69824 RepID=UPI0025878A0B|nr:helix-turn-helix transcriptional regulator [Thomasclavelia cocleata]MCI8445137.1 helix-turn-helix transcriptional regulator [Bacilli bacterium]
MNTNKLRDLREDRDLTQADIAEILNVNQTTYSRYERGDINNIPLDVLIKMALFFDTSIDYILNVTDNKNPYKRKKMK